MSAEQGQQPNLFHLEGALEAGLSPCQAVSVSLEVSVVETVITKENRGRPV